MDVVNGKIVETAIAARDGVMADHSSHAGSGVKPSRGFRADAGSFVHPKADPQVAGNFSQRGERESAWAPCWGTSPLHTWDGVAPAGLAPGARWNRPERGRSGAVHDFTGLQAPLVADQHRQGWKRSSSSGLCAMDVVNGKIVEPARTTAESHALGLQPSRARVPDVGSRRLECIHGKSDQLPGSFARAEEMAASWASSWAGSYEPMPSSQSWGMAALGHGASAPGAPAGWNRLALDRARGSQPPLQPEADHRDGWTRRINTAVSSPRWGTDQRHPLIDSSSCSERKLDEEMTMLELQLTRTVSGHYSHVPPSLPHETSSPHAKNTAPVATTEARSGDAAEKKTTEPVATTPTSTTSALKRRRSKLPDTDAQSECGWIEPLKLLVRKGLTVSDVGELGRIIVPKKDAESQAFPQIDTKEGTVLEMEDYTTSKRWYFRFKYWINNKSRMYVLENTGEFIKYHSLKEHDIFIMYEDGHKKLVVCGQKKSAEDLDPVLKLSKGSIIKSSTSEKQLSPSPPTSII